MSKRFTPALLVAMIAGMGSSAMADYTLTAENAGNSSLTVNRGDSFTIDVVLTSDASDVHDAFNFRVLFSDPGLEITNYTHASPFVTGGLDDFSVPNIAPPPAPGLPQIITAALTAFAGVDIYMSNLSPTINDDFGVGTLVTLNLNVPLTYTGPGEITIDTLSEGFSDVTSTFDFIDVTTNAGPTFTLDINLPEISYPAVFNATVIKGGQDSVGVTINNSAPAGAGNLEYTIAHDSGIPSAAFGPISNTPEAPLAVGASQNHLVLVDTTPAITKGNHFLNFTATSAAAENSGEQEFGTLTVLDFADPDFINNSAGTITNADTADTYGGDTLTIDFGTVTTGSPTPSATFQITNGQASFVSDAFLTSITNLASSTFSLTGFSSFADLTAGEFQNYSVSMSTAAPGAFSHTYTFNFSDDADFNGALTRTITLNVLGEVVGTVIPEPASFSLLALAGLAMLRRRK